MVTGSFKGRSKYESAQRDPYIKEAWNSDNAPLRRVSSETIEICRRTRPRIQPCDARASSHTSYTLSLPSIADPARLKSLSASPRPSSLASSYTSHTLSLPSIANVVMESNGGGDSDSSSSSSSFRYLLLTLLYGIEDVRPHGDFVKFQTAAYSNCLKKPS